MSLRATLSALLRSLGSPRSSSISSCSDRRKERNVNVRQWKYMLPACGLLAIGTFSLGGPSVQAGAEHLGHEAGQIRQEDTDWNAVAQALGKPGTMMPG